MTRVDFNNLIQPVEYGKAYEIRFKTSHQAYKLTHCLLHWTATRKISYLICWKRENSMVTIKKFDHTQLGIDVIRRYYDELSIREMNQIINSPLFRTEKKN